jgi:hypothetical protein
VNVSVCRIPTAEALDQLLSHTPADIIHFIGHAGYNDAQDEAYLAFIDDRLNETRLTAEEMGRILLGRNVRLVFLNACRTATGSNIDPPSRSCLAAALVQRGIPFVVGTQAAMPDSTAHLFSKTVYLSLLAADSISIAIRNGRRRMLSGPQSQYFDWGIPILYALDPFARLFPQQKEKVIGLGPDGVSPDRIFDTVISDNDPLQQLSQRSGSGALQEMAHARPPHFRFEVQQLLKAYRKGIISEDLFETQMAEFDATPNKQDATNTSERRSVGIRGLTGDASTEAKRQKVAIVDIDAKAGFLPDRVRAANAARDSFKFEIAYFPVPGGAVRTDIASAPQIFVPWLEEVLFRAPEELNADWVCCLTSHLMSYGRGDTIRRNCSFVRLGRNPRVFLLSAAIIHRYAKQIDADFTEAILPTCRTMIMNMISHDLNRRIHNPASYFQDLDKPKEDQTVNVQNFIAAVVSG